MHLTVCNALSNDLNMHMCHVYVVCGVCFRNIALNKNEVLLEKLIIINIEYSIAVPSQPPGHFSVTAKTSTSITASWQLLPADSMNGIIKGYKLFYKKKDSVGSPNIEQINNKTIVSQDLTELEEYTEYECQVLAFTSVGDGPKSTVKSVTTKEDGNKLLFVMSKCGVYSPSISHKVHGPPS